MSAQYYRRPLVRNTILASLSLQDLAAIGPFLESVILREHTVLQEPRRPVDRVYFIESGMVSVRVVAAGSILETAVVGFRGAVGASSVFGAHIPTQQSIVLFPGTAFRIAVDDLRRVMAARPLIRQHLASYVEALGTHGAQSGLCGVCHGLEPRLACWLCLTCDALDGHVIPVTHDYLATVLGMPRAGVTRALIRLEKQGLIHKMRGVVQVCDRKTLKQSACSCYPIIARAYTAIEDLRRVGREAEAFPELTTLGYADLT